MSCIMIPNTSYSILQEIGRGSYGIVYKCIDTDTQQIVAVKEMMISPTIQTIPASFYRQISLLKEAEHNNIVKMIEGVTSPSKLFIVFQYLEKDLLTHIRSLGHKNIPSCQVQRMLYQILSALDHCHQRNIMHRDLKPNNILLDKHSTIKIADFGLARTYSVASRPYSDNVVTLWYRAPELLLGDPLYTPAVDIWSAGCIFAEMIIGRPLFAGEGQRQQLNCIFKCIGAPTDETWPGVSKLKLYKIYLPTLPESSFDVLTSQILNVSDAGADLLQKMLCGDPRKRISARQALKHAYFSQKHSQTQCCYDQ